MTTKTFGLSIGSDSDDFLFTSTRLNSTFVYGMDGNDVIEDMSKTGRIDFGSDGLFGNYGDDLIITHAGKDVLGGGDDNDTLVVDKLNGDLKTVHLRGGSGDNTAIIVTDDTTLLDHDTTAANEAVSVDGYTVHLHRMQHVDFMTQAEFDSFKADWHHV